MPGEEGRTLVVTGHALAPKGTVLHERNKIVSVALEVMWETGKILNVETTFATLLCNDYVKRILIGKSILQDYDEIIKLVEDNFHVNSQRSFIRAFESAVERFLLMRSK